MTNVIIRAAVASDTQAVAALQLLHWPEHTLEELQPDMEKAIASLDKVFYIAFINDFPVGFAECNLRYDYVEGTRTSPVGYLEGIFVQPENRRQGIAINLVRSCEEWAKERGCAEFASDCEMKNHASIAFHSRAGFTETKRIVCFIKRID